MTSRSIREKLLPSGNRWYDKYTQLKIYLDDLRDMPTGKRNAIAKKILEIIHSHEPELIDTYAMDFPLDISRRRWYDRDPRLWLMFNALEHADPAVMAQVITFFENNENS